MTNQIAEKQKQSSLCVASFTIFVFKNLSTFITVKPKLTITHNIMFFTATVFPLHDEFNREKYKPIGVRRMSKI